MSSIHRIIRAAAVAVGAAALAAFAVAPAAEAGTQSFIGQFSKIKTITSTVPHNGDVNPYGVAVVPHSIGSLVKGDVLVSNFNNSKNLQGTGTTIVQVSPGGQQTVFAHIRRSSLPGPCPGGVGLTTALGILPGGWVVVGSMATVSSGSLAALFVSNVLNGTVAAGGATVNRGTVERLVLLLRGNKPPQLIAHRIIGSGFGQHTDPAALVVGPTGLGLNSQGTLFVADSVGNRIRAIPRALVRSGSAGTGNRVTSGGSLNTPLGLAIAPNGDVLTVNAGDGFIVETTPSGNQIAKFLLDKTPPPPLGAGALFGLAVTPNANGIYFVDDVANTLNLFH